MLEKIREIVAETLGLDVEEVKETSNFTEDLDADSLDLYELAMAFEDEFGKEIPTDDLKTLLTVADVVAYLEK